VDKKQNPSMTTLWNVQFSSCQCSIIYSFLTLCHINEAAFCFSVLNFQFHSLKNDKYFLGISDDCVIYGVIITVDYYYN
jgi:hypothetical protein